MGRGQALVDSHLLIIPYSLFPMILQDKNWQTYRDLKEALNLNLRRQLFLAVCDDPNFCQYLVNQLDMESRCNGTPLDSQIPRWVTLELEADDPNLVHQIDRWYDTVNHHTIQNALASTPNSPPRRRKDDWMKVSPLDLAPHVPRELSPGFQFFGVQRLTQKSPTQQWSFLQNLEYIAQRYLDLAWEWNLLIWIPRPWLFSIQQSVPRFWHCHTALFEFSSEPLPANSRGGVGLNERVKVLAGLPEQEKDTEEQEQKLGGAVGEKPRPLVVKTDTVEEVQAAIASQKEALEALEDDAIARLDLLNDLGNLYWILSRKMANREEGLEALKQAIHTYEQALNHPQIQSQPQGYARLQNNLGIAYGELSRHENPVEGLEKAIAAYQAALSYREQPGDQSYEQMSEPDLQHYASTQNNLGTAYWNLAQHQEAAKNLKQAIAAYQESLKYYHPDRDALSYGMIQNNLGTAYWNLSRYQNPKDYLQLAIWSYQLALQYRTVEKNPSGYTATQNNLGTTYWHLANQPDAPIEQRREHLKECIGAYQRVIETMENPENQDSLSLSFDPVSTHNNLGVALYQLAMTAHQVGSQDQSDRLEPLELSLKHHIEAWTRWQNHPQMAHTALNYLLQALRSLYNEGGIDAQNRALAQVPSNLLPEILNRL
ncbi:tetratricopeptide repeat protein [Roseofilum capinflatum]|uniref:Tetratricopeptide repeat protein n=1 Tax=Roseofilum capinflatum BLCC-M114 TaxID=3022440 RepID=A0ABT7B9C3_9CYAN|nr:tetratricopeptide repeat protein [Roseofilum capinflatum]MDJ1175782.1 tetratricopeptide repeat protein [Roseofilum capinflatum BLCC-M114]